MFTSVGVNMPVTNEIFPVKAAKIICGVSSHKMKYYKYSGNDQWFWDNQQQNLEMRISNPPPPSMGREIN